MSQPSFSAMQLAMFNAAAASPKNALVTRIARVADRIKPRPLKERVSLSFRTAQKLKNEGVI
jgi:hypothetical protein